MSEKTLIDCGTSYTKIYYIDQHYYEVIPSREFRKWEKDLRIPLATGYNTRDIGKEQVNELIALAEGGLRLIPEDSFTLLDCGARDVKYLNMKGEKIIRMDWNTECGAFAGQVIELLINYFNIDPNKLPPDSEKIPVVCAVLGMTKMFDKIAEGVPYPRAFMGFLKGIAWNCYHLVDKPELLYLSGGLCENRAFINSFPCQVRPLGRYVLLEGLKSFYENPNRLRPLEETIKQKNPL